jgi:hypothetical protein
MLPEEQKITKKKVSKIGPNRLLERFFRMFPSHKAKTGSKYTISQRHCRWHNICTDGQSQIMSGGDVK